MTEKEMYNLINNQNEQQSNGFAINEKERGLSGVFSALMRKVYTWMTLALVITGVTAYGMAASPTLMMTLMTSRGLLFGLVIAELALVFIITGALNRLSLSTATLLFIGAMAVYGYTTKKDLTSMGKILFMALIGLIIATVVNMFLKSSGFDYILSYVGVAIFTGLTAWDSQKIKHMLQTQYDMSEGAQKLALIGTLTLYLDFINLFLYLLRIFGSNKE